MTSRLRPLIALVTSTAVVLAACAPMPFVGSGTGQPLTLNLKPYSLKRFRSAYMDEVTIDVNTGLSAAAAFRTASHPAAAARRLRLAGGRFHVLHGGQSHPNPKQHDRDDVP